MRSDPHAASLFVGGVVLGLAVAGVTLLAIEAVRRARSRRAGHMVFIDGVHPPDEVVLEARPAEEGNSTEPPRLVSEMPEFAPMSQRW